MKRLFFGIALCGASFGVLAIPVRAAETAKTTSAVGVQDVRLQQEGLLIGRAVTSQGVARENVKVAVSFQGQTIAEATTNEKGMFAVKGLRGGVHLVQTEGKQEVVRLWTADAAPETAADGLVLADGQVVRGQQGPGGVGNFLADNLVGIAIVGATAGTAVAVSASNGDSSN